MKVFYKAHRNEDCPKIVNRTTQMGYQHCCVDSAIMMAELEESGRGRADLSTKENVTTPHISLASRWGAAPTKMCPYCGHVHEAVELTD